MKKLLRALPVVFCLVFAASIVCASPIINEVLFDPIDANEADGEWIEIYNDSGAAIDMTGYELTTQGATPFTYTFPSFNLADGAYVVVHVGSGTDTVTDLYAGETLAGRLDNSGDDLVLQNDVGTDIDYIAWGTGAAIEGPPAGLSWSNDIGIVGLNQDDSIGAYPSGIDEDDGRLWYVMTGGNQSPGADNGTHSDPTITFTTLDPASTSGCKDIRADIELENTDAIASIYDVDLVVAIPPDYYYISSAPAGTYNAGAHTVTFSYASIAKSTSETIELHVQGRCDAATGQSLAADVDWRRYPTEPDPRQNTGPVNSGAITLTHPTGINVSMGEWTTGDAVIWQVFGDVEYRVVVENTSGTGDMAGGASVVFNAESGLTILSVNKDGPAGAAAENLTLNPNSATWTTDPIPAGGSMTFYVRATINTIYGCQNTNATADATWGCADNGGAGSCAPLTANGSTLVRCYPSLSYSYGLPEGTSPDRYVNGCQEMTTDIYIYNYDQYVLKDVEAVIEIPPDFYFVSSNPAGATYDAGAHTITFDSAAIGAINPNSSSNVEITVKPSCNAATLQAMGVTLRYETPQQTNSYILGEIPVKIPVLNVLLDDNDNLGSTTIEASRGDTKTVRYRVVNSGEGKLDLGGADPGADLFFEVGSGLTDLVFYEGGSIFTPTDVGGGRYRWNSGVLNGNSTKEYQIQFKVSSCDNLTAKGDFSWGCADFGGAPSCSRANEAEGAVKIILKTPLIELTVPNIAVDWCAGDTVSIPVKNLGDGPARDVMISVSTFDLDNLDITPTADSDFSYTRNGDVAEFRLNAGDDTDSDGNLDDIAAGNTGDPYEIEFDIAVKGGGAGCTVSGGGTLLYTPDYYDDCDIQYNAGLAVNSYSVSGGPAATFSKSGPSYRDIGESGSWSFTITNTSTNPMDFEVVDDYPDSGDTSNGYGNFTITNADGGTDDGDTITWTVAGGNAITVPAGGSVTKTIQFTAPTNTCAGGNTYTNTAVVSIVGAATDCNGCPIPGDGEVGTSDVFINNGDGVMLDNHDRSLAYTNFNTNGREVPAGGTTGETCAYTESPPGTVVIEGGVDVTATIDFASGAGSIAPATWTNTDGAGNNISFIENLDNGFQIPAAVSGGDPLETRLGLSVDYAGTDVTGNVTVSDNGGSFTIDLGGIDATAAGAPSAGGVLTINYTLYAPVPTGGVSTHTFTVPNAAGSCLNNAPEEYDLGVDASVTASGAAISVSKQTSPPGSSSNFIDKCETATFQLAVSQPAAQGWTMYDVVVELDLAGNYEWDPADSAVFSSFTDETGAAVASFDPTRAGDVLTWNLGDLRTGGTIDIDLTKLCDPTDTTLTATIRSNTNCDNIIPDDDGSGARSNSQNGSYQATVLRQGEMELTLTPELYFVKTGYPSMRFYVTNSGNGYLYDIDVPLVLGLELAYLDASETLPPGTVMSGPTVVDDQHVTFHFDRLAPGKQLYVDFNMKLNGCTDLDVDIVDATWGCYSQTTDCQANIPLSESSVVTLSQSIVVVTEHSAIPSYVDFCGRPVQFTVKIANSGLSDAYEAIASETFAVGLQLLGDPLYRIDEDGDGAWDNPGAAGNDFDTFPGRYTNYDSGARQVVWNFMDPNDDGDESDSLISTTDGHEADGDGLRHIILKPGAKIELQFKANIQDCNLANDYYNGDKKNQAKIQYDKPCDHDNMGDPLTSAELNVISKPPSEANIDITMTGKNDAGAPWNGTYVSDTVRAESGQTIKWKIELESNGDGAAPVTEVTLEIPNQVYQGVAVVAAESSAGVSIDYVSGSGAAGDPLIFRVNNSNFMDDPDTSPNEETFLDQNETIVFEVETTIDSCGVVVTNPAEVSWGCCDVGGPPGSYGTDSDSVDLRTTPDQDPQITIIDLGNVFNGCAGTFEVTLENPNSDYSFYGYDLSLPIPGNYEYDDSTADQGTVFTYAGNTDRSGLELTQAEEEPYIDGGTLRWRGLSDPNGKIPDAKAILLPGETMTIEVNFVTDGSVCDTGPGNDPNDPFDVMEIPDFTSTFTGIFDDSCGDPKFNADGSADVDPEQADVDIIALAPDTTFVEPGDTVEWTFTLLNRGDIVTSLLESSFTLGDGYDGTTISRVAGMPVEDSIDTGANTVTWDRDTITLNSGGSLTWTYSAQVKAGGGDLSATVDVAGYCVNLSLADECRYVYDQSIADEITGTEIAKTITAVNDPAVITDAPTNTAADAAHGNVLTYTIQADFYEDSYTDVVLTDTLPAGLDYVSAVPVPDSAAGGVVTWNIGAVNSPGTQTFTVKARVADTTSAGDALTNAAELSFTAYGNAYDGTTHPAYLSKENTVTVKLPDIQDDANYAKTANPAGPTSPGALVEGGDAIDYTFTARNTGDSPAYDLSFLDTIPIGMRGVQPSITSVDIDGAILSDPGDYAVSWDAGTGELGIVLTDDTETFDGNETLTIQYTATVDADVGVDVIMNNAARVDSYTSLPDAGNAADSETDRTFASPGTKNTYHHTDAVTLNTKTVQTAVTPPAGELSDGTSRATIGEEITYRLRFGIPQNTTAYDVTFTDTIPDGLTVQSAAYEHNDSGGIVPINPLPTESAGTTPFSDVSLGDIDGGAAGNTVIVTIVATVDLQYNGGTDVSENDVFTNSGTFAWNGINDTPASTQSINTNSVDFTVLEPTMDNQSKTAGAPYACGGTVEGSNVVRFTFSAENTGGAAAHELEFLDTLPLGMRGAQPAIVSVTSGGTALTLTTDYTVGWDGGTGEFTINLLQTSDAQLDPTDAFEVVYDVTVETSVGAGINNAALLQNAARVDGYTSHPGSPSHGAAERAYPALANVNCGHLTPDPTVAKTVESAVTPPVGELSDGTSRATIGEEITYRLRFEIPQNTTAHDVTFTDTVPDGLTVQSATYEHNDSGGAQAMAIPGESGGATPFAAVPLGAAPDGNDIAGGVAGNTVIVTIVATVDIQYNGGTDVSENDVFTNQGAFTWNRLDDAPATTRSVSSNSVDFTILEPTMDNQAKTAAAPYACGGTVEGTNVVRFTFSAENAGGATAHELEFLDTLPLGMRGAQPAIVSVTSGGTALTLTTDYTVGWDGGTGEFTINLLQTSDAQLDPTDAFEVVYDVTVETSVGAGINNAALLQNAARVDGYTSHPGSPSHGAAERTYPALANVNCGHLTPDPTITKSFESTITEPAGELNDNTGRATIGETITYRIRLDIPANTTAYDLEFRDVVPSGLTVQSATYEHNDSGGAQAIPIPAELANGRTQFQWVGIRTAPGDDDEYDVAGGVAGNTVLVTITATVDQQRDDPAVDLVDGDQLLNRGQFRWNRLNGDTGTRRQINSVWRRFRILEPEIGNLDKDMTVGPGRGTDTFYWYSAGPTQHQENNIDVVLPGDTLTYEVTFENTGTTTAYDIVLNDALPSPGMTYVNASIAATASAGTDPTITVNTTAPLNATFDHLDAGATLTVTYDVTVDDGLGIGRFMENSVTIDDYSTLPGDDPLERDSDSTPAYADLGPVSDEGVGVQNTNIQTDVYRMYDDSGAALAPLTDSVNGGEVRLGEILQYEIEVDIWDDTAFFKGGAADEHFIIQVDLPDGVQRINGQDEFDLGTLSSSLSLLGVTDTDATNDEVWEWRFDSITNNDGADRTIKLVFKVVVTNDFNDYDDNSLSYLLNTPIRMVWDTTTDGLELGDVSDNDHPRLDDALDYTLTQPDINNADLSFSANPACAGTVVGGDLIDFTFQAVNSGSAGTKATAYDMVFIANIPVELRDVAGPQIQAISVNGGSILGGGHYTENWVQATGVFTVTLLQFADAQLLKGQPFSITFRSPVDGAVGTDVIWSTEAGVNRYTSFPSDADTLSGGTGIYPNKERSYGLAAGDPDPVLLTCDHGTPAPVPEKSVAMRQTLPARDPVEVTDNTGRASIGERVTHYTRLTAPKNTTIYDLEFTDTIPDGLTVHIATWEYEDPAGNSVTGNLTIDAEVAGTTTVHGAIGDVVANATTGDNDIVVTIISTVDQNFNAPGVAGDANNNGIVDDQDTLSNTAAMTWNRRDDEPATTLTKNSNAITFTILEPELVNLTKSFDPGSSDLRDSDGATVRDRGTDTFCYYDGPGAPAQDTATTDIVLPDDYLRFMITFQNTGTTTAYDIQMVDTYSSELSYNTDIAAIAATASAGGDPTITVNGNEPLDVAFGHLASGATLTVVYWLRVDQLSGAGRYLENSVEIVEYDTLDSSQGEEAGIPNMDTRERDTASANPYSDLGPVTESAGIQHATFIKRTDRLYDEEGNLLAVPQQINTADPTDREVRIGERIRYRLVVTLPRQSTLFDGAADHVIYYDILPEGYKRVAANDDFTQGDINITAQLSSVTQGTSGNQETNTWEFSDIVNSANNSQTAVVGFEVDVTRYDTGGAEIHTDNTTEVAAQNDAWIYWDTEETSGNEPGSKNAADCPFKFDFSRSDVVQPDLSISKAYNEAGTNDGEVVAGQTLDYIVTIENNTVSSTEGAAYDITFEDTIPLGMRDTMPTIQSVVIQDVATSTTQRTLVVNEDYTETIIAGTGLVRIVTQYDGGNNRYDARIGPDEKLVITYEATVDATVGAGTLINKALVDSYYSLPGGMNDPDRKPYGPLPHVYVVLQTEAVSITKSANPLTNSSVSDGETITYTLVVPPALINATLYDIELVDEIPNGLEIVDPQTGNLGAGDVQVIWGVNTAIAVSGARNRTVTITADEITKNTQMTLTITARVHNTFDDGTAVPIYHKYENFGLFYWYDKPAAPRIRYSPVSNKVSHVLKPTGMVLEPDHTENGQPGTIKIYRHVLQNFEEDADTFVLDYGPSTGNWEWMLYLGDGDGNIDSASYISTGKKTPLVPSGGTQELIAKAFIPIETPDFTTDVLLITATSDKTAKSDDVTDVTIVQNERMTIKKEASLDGVNYSTNLDVEPGDEVYQRLTFYGNGHEPVQNVAVYDAIPEHTNYVRNSATDDAVLALSYSVDQGVTWAAGDPPTDAAALQVSNLKWDYIENGGILLPGDVQVIIFQVRIK